MIELVAGELLGMSDEDFLKLNEPGTSATDADADTSTTNTETGVAEAVTEGGAASPTETGAGEAGSETNTNTQAPTTETGAEGEGAGATTEGAEGGTGVVAEVPGSKPEGGIAPETGTEGAPKPEAGAVTTPSAEVAADFYTKVMAPFKANGKTIELKSPEDVIALMQMGANYTRKMQDLQQHRKTIMMLQNNGLLDEGKLSYLIDLDKKNPEAIKKLVKDAGIDPMDIDPEAEPAYHAGNHQVTDEEVAFVSALEDLRSTPAGQETLTEINTTWDPTSKEALWKSPEMMGAIQQQRESGVYALITTEIDRRRTLGQIKPETPFLEAYTIVGDDLSGVQTGGAKGAQTENPTGQSAPAVLATRPATPKKVVEADDRASAAAPSRSTPSPSSGNQKPNYLAMSDEEFLKLNQFQGRV